MKLRHFAAQAAFLTAAAFLGSSCDTTPTQGDPDPQNLAQVQQPLEDEEVCDDRPAGFPVTARWLNIPSGTVEITNTVVLRLENVSNASLTLAPSLLAEGLDLRRAERSLEPVVLARGAVVQLSVDLLEVPVQSSTYSTQLHVRLSHPHVENGTAFFLTEPLYVHYDAHYAQATVYNEVVLRTTLDGGQLTQDPGNLAGRVWRNGSWTALDTIRGDEWLETGASGLPPLVDGFWWGEAVSQPDVLEISPCTLGSCDTICAHIPNEYFDGGAGDYGHSTPNATLPPSWLQQGTLPASYARARITRVVSNDPVCLTTSLDPFKNSCIEVVWDGYLAESGCADLPLDTGESYHLWLIGEARRSDEARFSFTEYNDAGDPIGAPGEVRVVRAGFAWPWENAVGSSLVFPVTKFSLALATASRVLTTDELMPAGAHIGVWFNVGGEFGGGSAHYNGFYTGPWMQADGHPGGNQTRTIIAHEAGHVIQLRRWGDLAQSYGAVNLNQMVPLCECHHVTTANQEHCLQSAETMSTAQNEGFAQFVAARTWNDPSESDCGFAYYKAFLTPTSTIPPPFMTSCITPVKWRNHHCPEQTFGTEYDWMHFYYRVTTTGLANRTTMANFDAILQLACGGDCEDSNDPIDVNGEDVTYQELAAAAQSHYGMFDPRNEHFRDRAEETGVDYDTSL